MLKRLLNALKNLKGHFSTANYNSKQALKKENRKNEILDYLKTRKKATNSELRKLTGLSSRSIVRYMNELEKEGLVEQIGKTGESVKYRFKSG